MPTIIHGGGGSKSFIPSGYELKVGETSVINGNAGSRNFRITEDIIPMTIQISIRNFENRSTHGSYAKFGVQGIGIIAEANAERYGNCYLWARCDLGAYKNYNFEELANCKNFYIQSSRDNLTYQFKVIAWLQKK